MDRLMRAKAAQRQLRKCARRHRRAARTAAQDRDAAQEARADDQAVLVGLREQLDAARTKAFTAMRQ